MKLDFFKDKLFDMLNECDNMNIADIETDDAANTFQIKTLDGDLFIIEFKQITAEEKRNKNQ